MDWPENRKCILSRSRSWDAAQKHCCMLMLRAVLAVAAARTRASVSDRWLSGLRLVLIINIHQYSSTQPQHATASVAQHSCQARKCSREFSGADRRGSFNTLDVIAMPALQNFPARQGPFQHGTLPGTDLWTSELLFLSCQLLDCRLDGSTPHFGRVPLDNIVNSNASAPFVSLVVCALFPFSVAQARAPQVRGKYECFSTPAHTSTTLYVFCFKLGFESRG